MGRDNNRYCKKRKACKEEKEDRISELPDDILTRIMRRLPLREIGKTCTVSRQWEKLWEKTISVAPCLEFHGTKDVVYFPRRMRRYVNLVNKVIKLHSEPTLEKFSIYCPVDPQYYDDLNNWIEFAARKGVKKLNLNLCSDDGHYWDQGTTCNDVRILANPLRKCLRYMNMRSVNVCDEHIEGLLSNSPSLEHLRVDSSSNLRRLVISSPNLKCFEIFNCMNLQCLNIFTPNLKHLAISDNIGRLRDDVVKIRAPNLMSFTYSEMAPLFFQVPVIAHDISHVGLKLSRMYAFYYNRNLFGVISQVKTLGLKFHLSREIPSTFPELSNLKHLELSIICFDKHYYEGPLWPYALIKAAPSLHSISFKLFNNKGSDCVLDDSLCMKEDIQQEVKVRESIRRTHTHQELKVIEFVGYTGCTWEVDVLLNLVELAISLDKLIIDFRLPVHPWSTSPQINYQKNNHAKIYRKLFHKLRKARIRPEIDVVVIY